MTRQFLRSAAVWFNAFDVLPHFWARASWNISGLWLMPAGRQRATHQQFRRLVADGAMWPDLVVVSTPSLHFRPGVFKAREPVRVQAFGQELAVKDSMKAFFRTSSRPLGSRAALGSAPDKSWSKSASGMQWALHRAIGNLHRIHYGCPHTQILTARRHELLLP